MLALYNLCAWIFPINFYIFEAWNIFCDMEIHVNFSRCIGLWQEKKCEKVSGPKIKIGYTWQEKNWNWSWCNFSNFSKRRIFSRDSRTLLILFSNFSCMFLNVNIFFSISKTVLIYQMLETSRNKLKKHSVTKNCSDLSLFE